MLSVVVRRVRYLLSQDFIRHNALFFAGTLSISLLNYLYYPAIGRLVSVSDFGEIQALISLFMELGVVLTVFGYITTNIVNNHQGKADKIILLTELERLALFVALVLFSIITISSFYLKTSLQFTSTIPLLGIGVLIILNVPSTFRTYYLQGEKRLKEVSVGGIIFAAGKLALSAGLIVIGWRVLGAVAGYILAQIATLYYVASRTHGRLPSVRSTIPMHLERLKFQTERRLLKKELLYGVFILVLLLAITVLYTFDAIIVRQYFDPKQAGFFSGISAVARIVFFVTASVAGVLIASVKLKNTAPENRHVLLKSMLLIMIIGGVTVSAFVMFPELLVSMLIGKDYVVYAGLLPLMAVSMLFCSFNNLIFSYQIALRRFEALIPACIGLLVLIWLCFTHHTHLQQIVYNFLLANLAVFTISLLQVLKEGRFAVHG